MLRSCSNCRYLIKIQSLGLGLCDYHDVSKDRNTTDKCMNWASIKYDRNEQKVNTFDSVKDAI